MSDPTDDNMADFDRLMSECITVYRAAGRTKFINWFEGISGASMKIIDIGFVAFFLLLVEVFEDFQAGIMIDSEDMGISVANVIEYMVAASAVDEPEMHTDMSPFSIWFNGRVVAYQEGSATAATEDE